LEPGLLPSDIFHAIARLIVTTTFVAVPLVEKEGRIFVLLNRRSETAVTYPSMLDLPGTIIRADDADLPAVFLRLKISELPNAVIRSGPVFVGPVFDEIDRGREISLIHWIEIDDDPLTSGLFDVDALPDDIVRTDRARVAMAAEAFRIQSHRA
jgi:hypothetical protein